MITTLTAPRMKRRASVRSADGAAWRIKPEIRTLANIIRDAQPIERLLVPSEEELLVCGQPLPVTIIRRGLTDLSNPFRSI